MMRSLNRLLLAITAAAAACGFVFVLNLLLPLTDRKNYILMGLGIVCAVIGAIVAKGALFLQVWAIGCATAAPTAAILLALDHWKKKKITRKLGYGRVVRDGTIGLFFAVAVAAVRQSNSCSHTAGREMYGNCRTRSNVTVRLLADSRLS